MFEIKFFQNHLKIQIQIGFNDKTIKWQISKNELGTLYRAVSEKWGNDFKNRWRLITNKINWKNSNNKKAILALLRNKADISNSKRYFVYYYSAR